MLILVFDEQIFHKIYIQKQETIMKIFKQVTLLLILTFFLVSDLLAQDNTIMQSYNRPTIANLCLVFGDETTHEKKVRSTFEMLPTNPKFNLANMDFHINAGLSSTDSVSMYEFSQKKDMKSRLRRIVSKDAELYPADDAIGMRIRKYLEEESNIGGDIMAQWAKQENGEFVTINQRSKQNMSVADYQKKTDAQKLAVYEDMLRNNFVIVYNVSDWRTNKGERVKSNVSFNGSKANDDQIVATVHAFIYKVDISDEQFGKEVAPNFGNISKIKSINYPIKYIGHTKVTEAFVPEQRYDTGKTLRNMASFKQRRKNRKGLSLNTNVSENSEAGEMAAKGNVASESTVVDWEVLGSDAREDFTYKHITEQVFDGVIKMVEMTIPEFQVKTELTGTSPLIAPIGLREGVKAGQRYRVYENVYKRSQGKVKTKSKGLVIATTKVGDNKEDVINSETDEAIVTKFKQVNGGKLRANMYMVQDNDYGLSLSLGTQFGYFGNDFPSVLISGRGETNVSNLVNKLVGANKIYGLYTMIGFGFGSNKVNDDYRINLINIDFGVSKRLYLHRKFDIIPELGITIGIPGITSEEVNEFSDEGLAFVNLGARFPIWVKENFAIEPALEIPIKISSNDFNPASILHFALRGRIDF